MLDEIMVPGHSLLIDDFESEASKQQWDGPIHIDTTRAMHGNACCRVVTSPKRSISLRLLSLPADWSAYDTLRFDIYSPTNEILFGGFNFWDGQAGDAHNIRAVGQGYENGRKLILIPGTTHVVVKLNGLWVNDGSRLVHLDNVVHFSIQFPAASEPLYIDNIRLTLGEESIDTASGATASDCIITVDGRWVTLGVVGPRSAWIDDPHTQEKRIAAQAAYNLLERKVAAAKTIGIDTLYYEIPLITGQIGLEVRPALPWFKDPARRTALYDYVEQSCMQAVTDLEGIFTPRTGATALSAPPQVRFRDVHIDNGFFRGPDGEPVLTLSVHGTDSALVPERPSSRLYSYVAPIDYTLETFSVGGGSRYDIESSPVYRVYKENPATHRVGWDGWCGHLIKDVWAMGGKKENVVICLEHPEMKRAIRAYMDEHADIWKNNPDFLFNNMAYELMYICYCETSQQLFRQWLQEQHHDIATLNACWGTNFASFADIVAPAVQNAVPLPGTNRATWYDWARFNQERFTRHLEWVKEQIQEIAPGMAVTCGGISSMFAGSAGTSGIDEELLVRRVDDVILNEAGNHLIRTDLQVSLGEGRKPLADPEHAGSVWELLPHYIHGNHIIGYYYWGSSLGTEFPHLWGQSLPHSWRYSLAEVGEFLRVGLDVRRLRREIAAFSQAPSDVKILYSHTNMLQIPPDMLRRGTTPYLSALHNAHTAGRFLDTRTLFITERQICEGKLSGNRVLVVPACRHMPPEVTQAILAFANAGGHVVVTPESFLADQYNRPTDVLEKLGVRVTGLAVPKALSGGLEQGYDQNLLEVVEYEAESANIAIAAGSMFGDTALHLRGAGIRQYWELADGITVLGHFTDGSPAIACSDQGAGRIYFLAASLAVEDYTRFLDHVLDNAKAYRPVRAYGYDSTVAPSVELRWVKENTGWLVYLHNTSAQEVQVRIAVPGRVRDIVELRSMQPKDIAAPLVMQPKATHIYRLTAIG